MSGFVSGSNFGRQSAIRIGAFLALTLGFPFIVYGLILVTGAYGPASGALAVVAGMYLRPIIVAAFLISMIGPCWRRMRSLALPAWWGLLVPLLFAADAMYLTLAGAHWGVAFSLGAIYLSAPVYAFTALVLVAAMWLGLRPSADEPQGLARFGFAGTLVCVLAIAAIAIAVGSWVLRSWMGSIVMSVALLPKGAVREMPSHYFLLAQISRWLALFKPIVCLSLSGLFIWFTIVSRRSADSDNGDGHPRDGFNAPVSPQLPGTPRTVFGKR